MLFLTLKIQKQDITLYINTLEVQHGKYLLYDAMNQLSSLVHVLYVSALPSKERILQELSGKKDWLLQCSTAIVNRGTQGKAVVIVEVAAKEILYLRE